MRKTLLLLSLTPLLLTGAGKFTQQAQTIVSPRAASAPASTQLLFPFVTGAAGFDTEITIVNTSLDTLGTAPQAGSCVVNYYGSGAVPGRTSAVVSAGKQLYFTIAKGGGVSAAPNFQGYLIANCQFLASGNAKISDGYGGAGRGLHWSQDAQVMTFPRPSTSPVRFLFPFASNSGNLDTGFSIANTGADPFGTVSSAGSCAFTFYGNNAPASFVTPTIAPGATYSNLLSGIAPGFEGYVVLQCTFSSAAAFGFLSDGFNAPAAGVSYSLDPERLTLPRATTARPLLFPAVSNQNNLDTTLAIANTTADPFGTSNTAGTCALNFYGSNAPAAITTPPIAPGTVFVLQLSTVAPGFQGYATASCTFPQARGYSFQNSYATGGGDWGPAEVLTLPRSSPTSSLLFADATNRYGHDTAFTISNTSLDEFGTTSGAGTCKISYFGDLANGDSVLAPQFSSSIAAGAQLSFTLSGGNPSQGIAATPGFQGYIFADCGFPLARGVASISGTPWGYATSLTPGTAPAGSAAVSLTVNGGNFVAGATVSWTAPNGQVSTLSPSLIQAAQLAATIPAALLTTAGTATVAITNTNGSVSNALPFTIAVPSGPPTVVIDAPVAGATLFGTVTISGWALDNVTGSGSAIGSVIVRVDGNIAGTAVYGSNRQDACNLYPGRPGCPNVGFSYQLNTASLTAGAHTITVSATDADPSPDTGTASVSVTVVQPVPSTVSVTPAAGSGVGQAFTAVYSDTAGAAVLSRRIFLINSTLNGTGACYVQVTAAGIYLVNDAGTAVQAANALSNSQCAIDGANSRVVNSGNTSTVTLALAFTPAFAGAKNIYMYAEDSAGNSGFLARGTFTVLAAASAPAAVSVTPNAASGFSQTFSAVYTNNAGASYLTRRLFLINSSLSGAGACFVQIDASGIYLINDAGTGLIGPVTAPGSVTNSQCTLNGTGTGNTNSGSTSTVALALTFKTAFTGAKNIYMYAEDPFGNGSGFQSRGAFTVAFAVPTADSVTPSSSTGIAQVFTANFSDTAGAGLLTRRLFLINSVLSGANACFVQADASGISLVNDAGSGLLRPTAGNVNVSNSQCTLNGGGSAITSSGNTSVVTVSITFNISFGGAKNIYMYAEDSNGYNSGFQLRGTYGVTSPVPTVGGLSPVNGSGVTQTFTANYSDGAGAAALNRRLFLINSTLSGAGACFIQSDPTGVYLVNDAGNALLTPATPGGSSANSQCTLNSASVGTSGAVSSLTFSVTFNFSFAGLKNIYLYAEDLSGKNSGFQALGTYYVYDGRPTVGYVTQRFGSGANQTLRFAYNDPAGREFMNRRLFLINSTLNGTNACFVVVTEDGIFLANDDDSKLSGSLLIDGDASNSQCTLNASGSGLASTATRTEPLVSFTFKPGFGGTRNIYMYVDDIYGNNSGWVVAGTIQTQ